MAIETMQQAIQMRWLKQSVAIVLSAAAVAAVAAQAEARGPAPSTAPVLELDAPGTSAVVAPQMLQTVEVEATRLGGPTITPSGSSQYTVTQQDILNLPVGENSNLSDVLEQMPGVSIDQNQQIHIRDTEGPQYQYQINGVLVPLDINTNPPFLSMINPMFVNKLNLLTGILPARYSYATGGVIDIDTKQGCGAAQGDLSVFVGQRDTFQPSAEYSGCHGQLDYYVSGLYSQSDLAFSSATPGPTPYHDWTNSGQLFGIVSYPLSDGIKFSLIGSTAASNNQLPNRPALTPQYSLAGTVEPKSQDIDSYLNFRDALAVAALNGAPSAQISWQLAYSFHTITQAFRPDDPGELIYEGVASTAQHQDVDNALEGDISYHLGGHTVSSGFYGGAYDAHIQDHSLVFPVDVSGAQTSSVPLLVTSDAQALNWLSGVYLNDLWAVNRRLSANVGVRWDKVTGFTSGSQLDPTANLFYQLAPATTIHGGFARYFQVPLFQGISPSAPTAFAGTSGAGPAGAVTPVTEDDDEWDVGLVEHVTAALTLSADNYYENTHHHLDTGQFGVVPIFAPFNYQTGHMWGSELAAAYRRPYLSAYVNVTLGADRERGIATGQFNFDPQELAFIDSHYITLDHQPLVGASAGVTADWQSYRFSADGLFSSGLRAGFADQERLPDVFQLNVSAERDFIVPGVGTVIDRLSLVNVLDKINLIRPANGIGIFQAAYGPRFTIYDTLTIRF